jgi:hypothetical protein
LTRSKKEFLKWLLESIDTLLESLLEATGMAGAIKEIKECLCGLIDLV